MGSNSYYLRTQVESRKITKKSTTPASKMSTEGRPPRQSVSAGAREKDHVTRTPPNASNRSPSPAATPVMEGINELKKMFATLNSKIDYVLDELNSIKQEVAATKQNVSEIEESVSFANDKIADIERSKIPELREKVDKNREEMEAKLLLLEIHDRKQTLLIYGCREKENEKIYSTVQNIVCHFLEIPREEAMKMPIVNAHRLPSSRRQGMYSEEREKRGPDPIIIRFGAMADRDRLLTAFERRARRPTANRHDSRQPAPPGTTSPMTTRHADLSDESLHDDGVPSTSTRNVQDSGHRNNTEDEIQREFSRITIRTDLPPALKRERGRLASVAFKLRREQRLSTRIKLLGTKIVLQTRKISRNGSQPTPWKIWSDDK